MDGKKKNSPFPKDMMLSKVLNIPTKEESEKFQGLGYQKACGMILWAARNVYVECSQGISQLCRVMSSPSKKAFEAAIKNCLLLKDQCDYH